VSNPDFSGSYPPDPAEPGHWGRSRGGQRGEGYTGGRRARGTRDAGDRGYPREQDYEWDRGGADPGYGRADRARGDSPRGNNGDCGRAGGRNGGSRADQDRADPGRADQGPADQGRASQSWASQDQGRAGRGSRRTARDAAKGRRGAPGGNGAASRMSAKDRLVAKLGTDQPAAGFSAAGMAGTAAGMAAARGGRAAKVIGGVTGPGRRPSPRPC
jgi:hypothetical protein